MPTASISRRLSRWVAGLAHSDIPPEVLDRARGVTLQGLSSSLLGHDFPETKQAIRLVEEEEAGCSGTSTALVDGRRLPATWSETAPLTRDWHSSLPH
jgi:hypothetical protein